MIERLPGLRLIVTTGRANASIDLEAARARGITVCGTESLASAPAELTWALILGLARHLPTEGDNLRSGRWQSTVGLGLAGRTLGVIGLGRIGSRVAAVGARLRHGRGRVEPAPHRRAGRGGRARRAVDLDDLLRRSDVVSLHLPLKPETRGLLDAGRIALMKPTALLVNTSRAGLLDVDAAVHAVTEGRLGGLGLDVFDQEPLPARRPAARERRGCWRRRTSATWPTTSTRCSSARSWRTSWRSLPGEPVRVLG